MNNLIVLQKFPSIDYAILYRLDSGCASTFVAAWGFKEDSNGISWGQGHYFSNLLDCVHYIESKLEDMLEKEINYSIYKREYAEGVLETC